MHNTRLNVALETALVVWAAMLAWGCSSAQDHQFATASNSDDASSAPTERNDAGPRDTAPPVGEGERPTPIDFLLSGTFHGSVTVETDDSASATEHRANAILVERQGRLEGVVTVTPDSDRQEFEYVLEGELDEERTAASIELSARRCPFGTEKSCTDALQSDQLPEQPMLEAEAKFDGMQLEIDEFTAAPQFDEAAAPDIEPILRGIQLTPDFDVDDGRFSPGDGVKPAGYDVGTDADSKSDAGETEPGPLPLGESSWTGRLTNGSATAAPPGEPVDCRWTVFRGTDFLELQRFECKGEILRAEANSPSEPPRVVPGSVTARRDFGEIWFLVETSETHHLFVGERVGHLLSGVVVRDPELRETSSGELTPVRPQDYSPAQVEGAFHWTRD